MEVRYVTDRHDTLCAKYRQEYRDNPDYLYCGIWTWRRRIRF